jgi:hypothetical protein
VLASGEHVGGFEDGQALQSSDCVANLLER